MNELKRVREILFSELEGLHGTSTANKEELKARIAKGQAVAKLGAEIIEAAKTELIGLKMLQQHGADPLPLPVSAHEDVSQITGLSQTAYERAALIAAEKRDRWRFQNEDRIAK